MERTLESVIAEIRAWDCADVYHLRDLLDELCSMHDDAQNLIDMSDLPSAPIPDDIDTGYPVWAVDTAGFALVGPDARNVQHLDQIREFEREDETTD